ncbi:MAG: glycosyl hydrolase family 28-related protein [Flavobacteriaceae bacterium]
MNIKIIPLIIWMCFFEINILAQEVDFSKYPSAVISNNEVSMKVYLPDRKKGVYRSTRFDWSGQIESVKYNGHEYFGQWKDTHNPLAPAHGMGPVEASNGAGLGYDEASPGEGFIRLGVGIIEKGNEPEYDFHIETYKILDHGKWKIDKGDDWITFKHTIKSDFGYAYVYEKTLRLSDKGFYIEHRLQNTGQKKIELDQYNHNFFVIDKETSGPSLKVRYPFKIKTKSDTKGLVEVGGNSIRFNKEIKAGNSVFVNLEGFKESSLNNKFTVLNMKTGAGVTVSTDQPIIKAQFWAKNSTLCPEHLIELSIPSGEEKTWTSKYILYEAHQDVPPNDFKYTKVVVEPEVLSIVKDKWQDKFKHVEYPRQWLDKVIAVEPGDDIQSAIDEANAAGGGVVFLKEGTHMLNNTLTLKSKVTIAGEGKAQTVLLQSPDLKGTGFIAEDKPRITDVVIKDLTLRGMRTGDGNGVLMRGRNESRHTRIMFQNIMVSDWSKHGIHIKRTNNIIMDKCDIQYNGSAGGLHHNVYFLYNKYLLQSDCDMSFPVKGKGNKYTSFEHVIAQRITIRGCKGNGIQADHEEAGYLFFHKYNISGVGRAAMWFPCEHYYDKYNYTENTKYAPQNVILNRCEIVDNAYGAMWRRVNGAYVINCKFDNKKLDMALFKCDVTMENSEFLKGIGEYHDIDDWPQGVNTLW